MKFPVINYNYFNICLSFLTSLIISYKIIPPIAHIARFKNLFDKPNDRNLHTANIPNIGGLAIVFSLILSLLLYNNFILFPDIQFIIASMLIIAIIGVKDDILVNTPLVKLIGQFIAAIIIVILADIRFTNLYGIAGVFEISYTASVCISLFAIIVFINSFNLIDGIDGLASGIGIITTSTFAVWFAINMQYQLVIFSVALIGSLFAFFYYNVFSKDNKIFMGDTGSLLLGLFLAILTIKFNEINLLPNIEYPIKAAPAVSFCILIIPLGDTIRVFIIRAIKKKSPLKADKNHLHHKLVDLGLSHIKATSLLLIVNC